MTLRNDATRPEAHLTNNRRLRSVVARQGQVLLDIDVNTAGEIAADRTETEALDTLGTLAAPFDHSGFMVGVGGTISAGRIYLDGLLVENPFATTLTGQPHPADPLPAGPSIVGLKALIRHIDPVEDRRLTDKALADAATSGRALIDWQVFAVDLRAGASATCDAASSDWDKLTAPSSGRLSARVDPGVAAVNFCTPAAGGGYTRLENLLYRIEVDGGTPVAGFPTVDGPRFGLNGLRLKLSRRNASVMTRIVDFTGRELTVDPPALDAGQWFAAGGVAELVSLHDDVDPRGAASQIRLYTVNRANDDRVTLAGAGALPLPAASALNDVWYLRLWDAFPGFEISATATGGAISGEINCGAGVLITLQAAVTGDTLFRRGDWWSFTARIDGTIDWPESAPTVPMAVTPHGPTVHYARLAATASPAAVPVDCRPVFLPLSQQITLHGAGGDGQAAFLGDSAAAFVPLRVPLRIIVLRGGLPVVGAMTRWSFPAGAPVGQLDAAGAPVDKATDATGLVETVWSLDRARFADAHRVLVELVLPVDHPPVAPLQFAADFDTADRTSYQPGACALLSTSTTVQEALDTLCQNIGTPPPEFLRLRAIEIVIGARQLISGDFIQNGIELDPRELQDGIVFRTDQGPLVGTPEPFDPIVDIELELPYPTTKPDADYWKGATDATFSIIGTQRLRLDGTVTLKEDFVIWRPSKDVITFLSFARRHLFGEGGKAQAASENFVRILTRLRLRSQFVWILNAAGERIYLNAEHLGVVGPITKRELSLPLPEPRRAADLDMFFYLVVKI